MRPARTIQNTYLAMTALQTIGTVDLQRKLPAPKQYVTTSVVWGILFLFADGDWGKVAAQFSKLLLLTGMVLGPFGKRLVNLFDVIAHSFTATPPTTTGAGGTAGTALLTPSDQGGLLPANPSASVGPPTSTA